MKTTLSLLASLSLVLQGTFSQVIDPTLVSRLRAAPTHTDRISLLKDEQFVFNFLTGVGASTGAGGRTISANSGNFPALIGNGVAMTYGYLEPCGMNIPHTHPRATEINIAVNGTLRTGMLAENGARFVFNNVPAGSATVFPQGAIHFEMNLECHPTLFIAAFNHEDPGALAVAQRFFGIPTDIIAASLDSIGIVEIAEIEQKIPNNVALGTADCLARCGIQRTNQPTSQRQPRLPSNPLPPGYSGPPVPSPPPMPPPLGSQIDHDSSASVPTPSLIAQPGANLNSGLSAVWRDKQVKGFLVALLVINGIFAIGTLTALFLWVARSRGPKHAPLATRDAPMGHFAPLEKDYYDPYEHHRSPSPVAPERNADR